MYISICEIADQSKFEKGTQSLCTGTTLRDGIGREAGGGGQFQDGGHMCTHG